MFHAIAQFTFERSFSSPLPALFVAFVGGRSERVIKVKNGWVSSWYVFGGGNEEEDVRAERREAFLSVGA
jgi:hypothetical protein